MEELTDLEYNDMMDEAVKIADEIVELLEAQGSPPIAAAIACKEIKNYLEQEYGFEVVDIEPDKVIH